jgi:TraM recognition site of TraD and TraG/Helicase HerA, central domain
VVEQRRAAENQPRLPNDEPSVDESRLLLDEREGWTEGAFILAPTARREKNAADLDSYRRSAAFLARVAGERREAGTSLRQLDLVWSNSNGLPTAHLVGRVGGHDRAQVSAATRHFATEIEASLRATAPRSWELLDPAEIETPPGSDAPTRSTVRLQIVPRRSMHQVVIYPLHGETIERELRRLSSPATVRIGCVIFPRRALGEREGTPALDSRLRASVATLPQGDMPVRGIDPAEQWLFGARLDVEFDCDPPTALLSAIAAEVRGTGVAAIDGVLSGTSAWVDAEWVTLSAATSGRSSPADPDEWPRTAAIFNLREMACFLPLPTPAVGERSVPDVLVRVPDASPAAGLVLGRAVGGDRPVRLGEADRFLHMWCVGRTGSGKTTLLRNMLLADLRDRRRPAVVLFDPHGELADSLEGLMPAWRVKDVIIVDPGDEVAPVAHNPIWTDDPSRKDAIVDALAHVAIEMFDRDRSALVFGPIAERAYRNMLHTVMSVPGTTIVDAQELLIENELVARYLPHLKSRSLRKFWEQVERTTDREKGEQLPYLASKFGPFLDSLAVRRIVDHPNSTLIWDEVIDQGYVVLVPLDAGRIGPEAGLFLARIFLHGLIQAAKRRGSTGKDLRPIRLYIDEVQRLAPASPALETALSEGRKYRISTVIAQQNPEQLPDSLRASIEGNCQTIVSFGVGVRAAPLVSRMLGGDDELAEALGTMPNYQAVVRTAISGVPQLPLLVHAPPPVKGFSRRRLADVRSASRARFGREWTDRTS